VTKFLPQTAWQALERVALVVIPFAAILLAIDVVVAIVLGGTAAVLGITGIVGDVTSRRQPAQTIEESPRPQGGRMTHAGRVSASDGWTGRVVARAFDAQPRPLDW